MLCIGSLCMWFKRSDVVLFENLFFMSSNWVIMSRKQPKNIFYAKDEGAVDHSRVNWLFKKFCLVCKDLDDQQRSGWPKTSDSEAMLKAIKANPVSSFRESGNLSYAPRKYEVHTISFQTFFVWAILLIVHTWNSSLHRSNLLRLYCTCTVPTTSWRPNGSPLVWACQWTSSQPLSSPQLSHNDTLWA